MRAWLPALPLYLFVAGAMVALTWLASYRSPWYLLFLLGPLWLLRGLIAGAVEVVVVPVRHMEILFDEDTVKVLQGRGLPWWAHLDSIVRLEKYRDDLWSFVCYHGEHFDVPVSLVREDTLAHVRRKMEWAKTPEGFAASVNRGRRMLGLKEGGK